MINAQDIKIGTCIRMDGKLYFCIDFLHVKPGKGNTSEPTPVETLADELWLGVKFQTNSEIAGSPRNSFRASVRVKVM